MKKEFPSNSHSKNNKEFDRNLLHDEEGNKISKFFARAKASVARNLNLALPSLKGEMK